MSYYLSVSFKPYRNSTFLHYAEYCICVPKRLEMDVLKSVRTPMLYIIYNLIEEARFGDAKKKDGQELLYK